MYPSVSKIVYNFKFYTEMAGRHVPVIKSEITYRQTKKESESCIAFLFVCLKSFLPHQSIW